MPKILVLIETVIEVDNTVNKALKSGNNMAFDRLEDVLKKRLRAHKVTVGAIQAVKRSRKK
jgi:hypothetical protein